MRRSMFLALVVAAAGCGKEFNYDYCKAHPGSYPQYCGLDGSAGGDGGASYSIGGNVTGLTGTGLVLLDNGGDNLAVAPAGGVVPFTFHTRLADGSTYVVTVGAEPTNQSCNVANATGTLAGANVTDVVVTCTTTTDVAIACGGSMCTVGTQECCHDQTQANGACQTAGTTCPSGSAPQACDDASDCGGTPNVCCAHLDKNGALTNAVCETDASKCVPQGAGSVELLCNTMEQTPCPGTKTCTAVPARGWSQCQ